MAGRRRRSQRENNNEREPLPRAASPPATRVLLPFEFRGNGSEYFRIWIVNLLLTIVTLGIYSAWAKVRRLRYFYGNTFVDGQSFEYHGQPLAILKGRLIVFGGYVVFVIASQMAPCGPPSSRSHSRFSACPGSSCGRASFSCA